MRWVVGGARIPWIDAKLIAVQPSGKVLASVLNRAALILRYKQPFVDWINAVDPVGDSPDVTLADLDDERTVYLIEVEGTEELAQWLSRHHEDIFEAELYGWYTDPSLWPRDRSLKKLTEWCSCELHTIVLDWGQSPIKAEDF